MPTADLTVFMSNYNHGRFLPRSLGAILGQSLRPREVIVADDCSTDDSLKVLDAIAKSDPIVRVIRNERNRGVCANYNHGTEIAAGKYLLLAGADDYVLPGFFEKAIAQLEANPHAGLCCGYDSYCHGADGAVMPNASGWCEHPRYFAPAEVGRLVQCNLAAHGAIVRRDSIQKAGGYPPDLEWYADWFGYLTVAFRQGLCHVPEPLAVRTLDLAEAYSADVNRRGEKHVGALEAYLRRITSPEYADVAPFFRRSGVATYFGPDLVRAAARRDDRWEPHVLGFLYGLRPAQYEELLTDADPRVRELARHFLAAPLAETIERRKELEDELQRMREEYAKVKQSLPPAGVVGKLRWLAAIAANKVRRKAG